MKKGLFSRRVAAWLRIVICLLLVAGLVVTLVQVSQPVAIAWEKLVTGPTMSFVWAIALDPSETETIYVGTHGGGVYKSTDGGATWLPKSEGLESLQGRVTGDEYARDIRDILISRNQPGAIYVATWGREGIYRSDDAGERWRAESIDIWDTQDRADLLLGDYAFHARVLAETGTDILAGTAGGVLRLVDPDRGLWQPTELKGQALFIRALLVHPRDAQIVYAASLGQGVFESKDGGTNWQPRNLGLDSEVAREINALALDPADPAVIYAGSFGDGVYRSLDGGQSWSAWSDGLPAGAKVWSLCFAPDGTLFVGLHTEGTYRWAGAEAWQPAALPHGALALEADPRSGALYAGTWGRGLYRLQEGADAAWQDLHVPGNPLRLRTGVWAAQTLYVGSSNDGVYASQNGGQSWERQSQGLRGGALNVLVLTVGSDGNTLYAGTGDGVYVRPGGEMEWHPLGQAGTSMADVSIISLALGENGQSGDVVYAGTQEGLWTYDSSRQVWAGPREVETFAQAKRVSSLLVDRGTVYASFWGEGVRVSTDLRQWQPVPLEPHYVQALILADRNWWQGGGRQFYALTERGIYGSPGGAQWVSQYPGSAEAIAVDPRHPQVAYASLLTTTLDFQAAEPETTLLVTPTSTTILPTPTSLPTPLPTGTRSVPALSPTSSPTGALSVPVLSPTPSPTGTLSVPVLSPTPSLTGTLSVPVLSPTPSLTGTLSVPVLSPTPSSTGALSVPSLSPTPSPTGTQSVLALSPTPSPTGILSVPVLSPTSPPTGTLSVPAASAAPPSTIPPSFGILVSINNGRTWQDGGSLPDRAVQLLRDPGDRQRIFALAAEGGLFRGRVHLPWLSPDVWLAWLMGLSVLAVGVVFYRLSWLVSSYGLTIRQAGGVAWHHQLLSPGQIQRLLGRLGALEKLIVATVGQPTFSLMDVWEQLDDIGVSASRSRLMRALNNLVRDGLLREQEGLWRYTTPGLPLVASAELEASEDILLEDVRQETRILNDVERFFQESGFDVRQDVPRDLTEFVLRPLRTLYQGYDLTHVWLQGQGTLQAQDVDQIYRQARGERESWADESSPDTSSVSLAFVVVTEMPHAEAFRQMRKQAEGMRWIPLSMTTIRSALRERSAARELDALLHRESERANLYDIRTAVIDRLDFFGRQEIIDRLEEDLQSGRSVDLWSLPGVGKTSLAWHLKDTLVSPLVAYADLEYGWRGEDLFQQQILDDLVGDLWLKYRRFPGQEKGNFEEQLLSLLHQVPARTEKTARLVLVLDGLSTSPRDEEQAGALERLRKLAAASPGLSLIVTWQDPELLVDEWRLLGTLSRQESETLITVIGAQMGLDFAPASLASIYRETGGHPLLLRQLGSALARQVSGRSPGEFGEIGPGEVEKVLADFEPLRRRFFADVWRWSTDDQREKLRSWLTRPDREKQELLAADPYLRAALHPEEGPGDPFRAWLEATAQENH